MSTFDYQSLLKKVDELITRFGREFLIIKESRTPADPDKPWRGPLTENRVQFTIKGVVLDRTATHMGDDNIDRSEIIFKKYSKQIVQWRNKLVYASPLGISDDLTNYDFIVDGDHKFRIVEGNVLRPGDVSMLYEFKIEE